MAVRFFGQFLVDEGLVDALQLQDVSDHTYFVHRTIGELAIKRGLLAATDLRRVLARQEDTDRFIGELLLEEGLLTPEQLDELLEHQRHHHARVGEVLLELGYLDKATLQRALLRYRSDQAHYDADLRVLPADLQASPAELVLDLLPRLALRMGGVHVRVGDLRDCAACPRQELEVGIHLPTNPPFSIGIGCSRRFAGALLRLARGSVEPALSTEQCRQALQVFVARLARQIHPGGVDVEAGSLPDSGYAFEFISTRGNGFLFLSPAASERR